MHQIEEQQWANVCRFLKGKHKATSKMEALSVSH
jgi:hypothetical protein